MMGRRFFFGDEEARLFPTYLACFAGRSMCVSSPSVHALLLLGGNVGFVSRLEVPGVVV